MMTFDDNDIYISFLLPRILGSWDHQSFPCDSSTWSEFASLARRLAVRWKPNKKDGRNSGDQHGVEALEQWANALERESAKAGKS